VLVKDFASLVLSKKLFCGSLPVKLSFCVRFWFSPDWGLPIARACAAVNGLAFLAGSCTITPGLFRFILTPLGIADDVGLLVTYL
jgi:hypothetical protein